ncbi:MAG TPA: hypothetical protein VFD17_00610 [Clostridia bacterium]|nr:hypothetical protein [Clostridia bacterium]
MAYKKWTSEEIDYLKDKWNVETTENIAISLDRSYNSVMNKALYIGLGPNNKKKIAKRNRTKEEENYLMENWGSISIPTIAKNLDRTVSAIQNKARQSNLGPFLESGDYITINQLMIAVMGDYIGKGYTLKQWIDKGLPVKTKRVNRNSFKIIYLHDWWDWAQMNSTLIDFSKLKPLMLGKEPKWLEDQRRADQENAFFKRSPWTPSEDDLLATLLDTYRYTYRELSLRLNRTEGAIKRRMIDLGIKARPIKMSNHNPWTEEETKLLIDLYHKGHCRNTMANYIDRSSQACSGKIERLIKEGVIFPRSEFRTSC